MHSHAYSDLSKVNAANSILLASSDCIGAGLPLPLYITTPSFNRHLSVVFFPLLLAIAIASITCGTNLLKFEFTSKGCREIYSYIYNIKFFVTLQAVLTLISQPTDLPHSRDDPKRTEEVSSFWYKRCFS